MSDTVRQGRRVGVHVLSEGRREGVHGDVLGVCDCEGARQHLFTRGIQFCLLKRGGAGVEGEGRGPREGGEAAAGGVCDWCEELVHFFVVFPSRPLVSTPSALRRSLPQPHEPRKSSVFGLT